jgi:1-acyl-sn-glycerol-3-phosphate acyltransferase
MGKAVQLVRSMLFIGQMYVAMAVIGLGLMPFALLDRAAAHRVVRIYGQWVVWSAGWMIGLKAQVRGPIPDGAVIVACKHQSFLDILMLAAVLPHASFVMKQELARMPVLGWYARRIGCVAVDRGKRSAAIKQMMDGVTATDGQGQLVIYPQGTRVPPGEKRPYKVGAGQLYLALGRPVVPAATNVGQFWPKRSLMRHPGTAVIEFLPVIPPGLDLRSFMQRIEDQVETASDRLMAEAASNLPAPAAPPVAPEIAQPDAARRP